MEPTVIERYRMCNTHCASLHACTIRRAILAHREFALSANFHKLWLQTFTRNSMPAIMGKLQSIQTNLKSFRVGLTAQQAVVGAYRRCLDPMRPHEI